MTTDQQGEEVRAGKRAGEPVSLHANRPDRAPQQDRWEHEGKLMGVEMRAGGVTFMLGQDDWKKGRDRVKGEGFRLYCQTAQDADRLWTDAVHATRDSSVAYGSAPQA